MKMWRTQLGLWRVAKKKGIELIDITAKSGDSTFAPDWSTVDKYKKSKKTVDDIAVFVVRYYEKLTATLRIDESKFRELLAKDEVVVACYCKQCDEFCHTQVFVEACEKLCKKWNIPFEYAGILDKEK